MLTLLLAAVFLADSSSGAVANMVHVPAGEFKPLYRPEKNVMTIGVRSLLLDRTPVTKTDFLRFVLANPGWQRRRSPSIFRDGHYLADWISDTSIPTDSEQRPVTQVSWFAARAYCASEGKRLLTTAEWEYVASIAWGSDAAARDEALRWYMTPHDGPLPPVGSGSPNALGLYDVHRLWEWVEDFNSSLVTGDNRSDTDNDRNLYCGAASTDALDRADYAAFMRYAFRSSLKASYGTHNLGFRCAQGGDASR